MKKCLLTVAAIVISIVGYGQSAKSVLLKTPMHIKPAAMVNESESATTSQSSTSPNASQSRKGGHVQTSSVCSVVQLGNAPNAFGAASGSRAQVCYDQNLNTVGFLHRARCGYPASVTNTGYY